MSIEVPIWLILTLKILGSIALGILAMLGIVFVIYMCNLKIWK